MGVPLVAAGRVIGLYAVDKAVPGYFTEQHLRLTEALAPHAAIGIHNARLFEQLQRSEERFRALVENSAEVVALIDATGVTLYTSRAVQDILGEPVEEMIGRNVFERVHPDDLAMTRSELKKCLAQAGVAVSAEFRMRHRDGSWRVLEAVGVNRLDDPAVHAIVVNYRDVTERNRTQEWIEELNRYLQRQIQEFRTLLEVIPVGIAIARDPACKQIEANPALRRLLGTVPGQNASFSPPESEPRLRVELWRDGEPLDPAEMPMQIAASQGVEIVDLEMDVVRDGRTVATIIGSATPLFDESGRPRGAIGAALDISERKRSEEQIRRIAYHDVLTGLPNRLLLNDRLALAVAQANRLDRGLAVLFLDIDRFKLINDSLGHTAGDRLIQHVAERLRACVREGDTVARLGGDEFMLLLPGVDQVVDAAKLAEKVLESVRGHFQLEGREIFASASIGVAVYPDDGRDAETLVKNADTALYRAKERGRDNYQLYTPAMNETALERLALESKLRRALANHELQLQYQPVLDLATRRICGFEALLRWNHPELGMVPPATFIPIAELTGLILPIGPWVLRTACAQARAWQQAGHHGLEVAVNLSARQFQQSELPAQVARALEETGLPPASLHLEITETSAMENAASTVRALHELKALGVGIAIDDFGTGYSSLSYLKRFPIDTLKIDQSFIRDIPADPEDAAIATAVLALARSLKVEVVAEGVETKEQLHFLAERRCDRVQGFLFSRALTPEACEPLLSAPFPELPVY
jgi:diguanylate cyclase (GGDEF)-like protein/PAS domain S-box-containing protein